MDEMLRLITWWFQYMDANMPTDKSKITLLCDRSEYKSSNSDVEFVKAASAVLQVPYCGDNSATIDTLTNRYYYHLE